jgi:hypothetical protein
MEHQGCLKCHKFYVGHRAHQCSTTISGKNYKTLTEREAQRAKNSNNTRPSSSTQISTIATVSDTTPTEQNDDFIAAVFPCLSSGVIGNRSFTDASDSSFASVSKTPPLKSKHFIWDCILNGPTVTFPLKKAALIDNGCHMVLIQPDIVKELGLPVFTLEQPEKVDVAISFSKSGIARKKHFLVQYVKLHPCSPDYIF